MMWAQTCSVAAALAMVAGAASAAGTYTFSGATSFIQDLDAGDGVDFFQFDGTWELTFAVPDQSGLTFVNNVVTQGGSRTTYTGVTLLGLTLTYGSETLILVDDDAPVAGFISLWDRANFIQGSHNVGLSFEIGDSTIDLDWVARVDTGDLAYGDMFTVGTPGPNTLDGDFMPLFANSADAAAQYSGADITIEAFPAEFGGRGRYFGDADVFQLIPTPGAAGVLALAGVAVLRRRRG